MTWKAVVVGFFVGLCALPALAFLYLRLGCAPVATSASPMPFEKYFARTALHARLNREMPRDDPPQPTEADLISAAREYRRDCAVCHGLPGQPKTATAKGMFPKPPQLFQGKGVTDDSAGETYWKVKNGIRLTGMPSYEGSLTDEQIGTSVNCSPQRTSCRTVCRKISGGPTRSICRRNPRRLRARRTGNKPRSRDSTGSPRRRPRDTFL